MSSAGGMHWFRLYSRIVDDEKLRLLAFEDRWHFVALCALKCEGILCAPNSDLRTRRIAVKLGVQVRELDEISRRLREVDLIDEHLNPLAWNDLQFRSDTSTERVKKYREKQHRNAVKRFSNVSETVQETELDTEVSTKVDSPSGDGPPLTVNHVFEAAQEMLEALGLPKPRDLTPERRQLIRARLRDYPLEDFLTVFAKCRASAFLRGDRGTGTPLRFDWLLQKRNFQKVLEGNYD
jgi:hypothetical protein